jgi:hypothetical protein
MFFVVIWERCIMDKDREDRSKYILMGVEPYEAKEGASAELYRPLSKQEATQKTWLKAFWLILLVGGLVIGIGIEAFRHLLH